jgi:hypothetical protein
MNSRQVRGAPVNYFTRQRRTITPEKCVVMVLRCFLTWGAPNVKMASSVMISVMVGNSLLEKSRLRPFVAACFLFWNQAVNIVASQISRIAIT